jgi:hypothetical protein
MPVLGEKLSKSGSMILVLGGVSNRSGSMMLALGGKYFSNLLDLPALTPPMEHILKLSQ